MKKDTKLVGYKGFNPDWTCNKFQFELGKKFEHEGKVVLCESGFHFCENPLDIFCYYPPTGKFAEVEADGVSYAMPGDSKRVCRSISIKSEISLSAVIKFGVDFILRDVDFKNARATKTLVRSAATDTGYRSAATNTGYRSAATNTGDTSAATNTGDRSAATNTGDSSAATNTGYRSAATNTGYRSAATNTGVSSAATNTGVSGAATNTGYRSAATNTGVSSAATNTGDRSAATNTGDTSAATNAGYRSAATNTGDSSAATVEGKESIALVAGKDSKAAGALGCWLVLTERDAEWKIVKVKAFKVDGNKIKAGIFYELKAGKAVEA